MLLSLSLTVAGCRQHSETPTKQPSSTTKSDVGPHGGIVVEVGPHALAEIVCRDGIRLDVFFLGEKRESAIDVDDENLVGFGVASSEDLIPTRLTLERQADSEANHFQMAVPEDWRGKHAAVVFPRISLAGQRWHFDFEIDIPSGASPTESPDTATDVDLLPSE